MTHEQLLGWHRAMCDLYAEMASLPPILDLDKFDPKSPEDAEPGEWECA